MQVMTSRPVGPETTVHAKRIEMMEDHEEVEEEAQ